MALARDISTLQSCFTRVADDDCAHLVLIGCTCHSPVSLRSAVAHFHFPELQYGTICLPMSHLRRRLRCLDSASKHSCLLALILTLSFDPQTIYTVSQKVSIFKRSVTLSKRNQFSKLCTAGKRMTFATKTVPHYPSHLRHVATLPWEMKNANFLQIFGTYGRKCKQLAFLSPLPLLFIHKFRYFQCLK